MRTIAHKQAATPQSMGRLGAALKAIRGEQDLTLAEVSEKTGISVSTLSKVENGKLSLSYEKLIQLSHGLQIDITRLFQDKSATPMLAGRRSLNRAGDGHILDTGAYHHMYLSADLIGKKLDPILADLKARTIDEFGELIKHKGEEFAFVVSGEVEFHSELYAPVILKEGDSIYFDSSMGHAYLAHSDKLCRVMSVCVGNAGELEQALASMPNAKRLANVSNDDFDTEGFSQ